MIKRLSLMLAAGVSAAVALSACRKAEPAAQAAAGGARPAAAAAETRDPVARLLAHTEAMVQILRDNEADPARAIQELTAYQQKNQAEIDQEKQAMAEYMQRDPMKAAAASSLYGMRSAELDARTAELTARLKAK